MSVYFIQSGSAEGNGVVKIGHSSDPERRIGELQSAVANPLRCVIRLLEGGHQGRNAKSTGCWAHLHIRGELFEFSEEMLTRDFGFADVPFHRVLSRRERASEAFAAMRAIKENGGTGQQAFAAWARIVANGSRTITIPKMSVKGVVEEMTVVVA